LKEGMKMEQEIYVVYGSTGEYSDHCEWPVRAFDSEQKAKDFVIKVSQRANEIFDKYKDETYRWDYEKEQNEHDPWMQLDYTGVYYTYWNVPFDKE
jgi:hypothetical protein